MIEDVEKLGPEVQVAFLTQPELLSGAGIEIEQIAIPQVAQVVDLDADRKSA